MYEGEEQRQQSPTMREKDRHSRETGIVPQTKVATSLFEDLALRSDEAAATTCATSTSTYNNAHYVYTYVCTRV